MGYECRSGARFASSQLSGRRYLGADHELPARRESRPEPERLEAAPGRGSFLPNDRLHKEPHTPASLAAAACEGRLRESAAGVDGFVAAMPAPLIYSRSRSLDIPNRSRDDPGMTHIFLQRR